MKIKTNDLTDPALDWAMAKIEHPTHILVREPEPCAVRREYPFSTDWSKGGPIIQRDFIAIEGDYNEWRAKLFNDGHSHEAEGSTPLIAAMRCKVASVYGNEVDVPTELC